MPCLEISLPVIPDSVRVRLAETLTAAFSEHTGHPPEIFGIRFFEYEWGRASSAGQICAPEDERPYLHMLLYTPRLKRAVKRRVVDVLNAAFVKAIGQPKWEPVIHLCEHPYDNVGVGGRLLSDLYPELAEKPFYYPTSDGPRAP